MDSDFCNENKNQNEPFLDLMLDSVNEEINKAPDCVCQTIIKRMEQLNEEISDSRIYCSCKFHHERSF